MTIRFISALAILALSITAETPQVPQATLYDTLFREVAAFHKIAATLRSENKSDEFIRRHHRSILALSQGKSDALVRISQQYSLRVADLDRQANELINAAKMKYKKTGTVPPAPAELKSLQIQREALTNEHVQALQMAFGPSDFLYFDSNVRRYVSANYKVVPLPTAQRP